MKLRKLNKRSRQAGFSLAEIMVVIVIIGLLATVVVPNVMQKFFVGQSGKAKADITTIAGVIDQFAIENNGQYPDSLERLVQADENGFKYLEYDSVPLDPWKNEYQYEPPGPGNGEVVLYSFGADGQNGGEGKDRDITLKMIKNGEI